MKVIITGSTGMVGKGVLYKCLEDPEIEEVLLVNRNPIDIKHDKINELLIDDFFNLSSLEGKMKGYDGCFFCLGVTSVGISQEQYEKLTYELTLAFAKQVKKESPEATFIYVSGQGTDVNGRVHWAQVKGKTENDLMAMFEKAYMFRPGYIQPMRGIRSRTPLYNFFYVIGKPLYRIMKKLTPNQVTNTDDMGKAMINATRTGYHNPILDIKDINDLAG